jgi:hypothetical protein
MAGVTGLAVRCVLNIDAVAARYAAEGRYADAAASTPHRVVGAWRDF